MATWFKSRMLIGLLSGFKWRACGNLAKICIILTATGQQSNVTQGFLIILFISRFFPCCHYTKREARHSSAQKGLRNTTMEKKVGKMLLTQFLFLCKLAIFCCAKPGIMKSTFLFWIEWLNRRDTSTCLWFKEQEIDWQKKTHQQGGDPKRLTPGPWTPTTDRVHWLLTDRSTDHLHGPPLRTTSKLHTKTKWHESDNYRLLG